MATNYHTANDVSFEEGYAPRWESAVMIGNSELWGSLEITTFIYTTYEASVGLQTDAGWQVGATNDLSFEYSKDFGEVEVGNIMSTGIYELNSEEANLNFSLLPWKPDALAMAFNSTYSQVTGTDGLIQFGGGCSLNSRPAVVDASNSSCNVSGVTALSNGIEYAVLTLYDTYQGEGFSLPFNASEDNPIDISLVAKPVLSLSSGTRIGNLYIATDA